MTKLAEQLESVKRHLTEMGDTVESMLAWSAEGLVDRHSECVRQIIANEPTIDQFQIQIDSEVIRLMTIYSPIARDLRFLLMVARINSELERIGDQALNNCEYFLQLPSDPQPKPLADLSKMSDIGREMLRDALIAFKHDDLGLAQQVCQRDDEVDALYVQTFRDLLTQQNVDPDILNESMTLILLARSLERIADHATNISEEVVYLVKGEDIRHQKGEAIRPESTND
jgi:phosphate transport system protein